MPTTNPFRHAWMVAGLAGAAMAAPALGTTYPIGPPTPTCATIPVATTDPAADPQHLGRWQVPPGGSCHAVTRLDGTSAIELRYPDGRLWAEWVYAPRDRGYAYHYPDGVILSMPPPLYPDVAAMQRVIVSTPSGRRALAVGTSRITPRATCSPQTSTLKVRPGQHLVVRPLSVAVSSTLRVRSPERPRADKRRAVVAQPGGRWLARWNVPARDARSGNLTLITTQPNGERVAFQVCLQVSR